MKKEFYMIAVKSFYYNRAPFPSIIEEYYGDIREAQAVVDRYNSEAYVLHNNEYSRPLYYVITSQVGEYILSGRNEDLSNYDWSGCDCTKDNGNCCGFCDKCIDHMHSQDSRLISRSSINYVDVGQE